MIWLFLVPFSFLEVVPSGTTQGYFHPQSHKKLGQIDLLQEMYIHS
jgi:hypothetical protein